MPFEQPPEPWHSLLAAIDDEAEIELDLVCIGGFALTMAYDAPRTTADLDVLWIVYDTTSTAALKLAERGGQLHKRLGVYLDQVIIATPPCDFDKRLAPAISWRPLPPPAPIRARPLRSGATQARS